MKIAKMLGYMSADDARAYGFTHHGKYYGIPLWIAPHAGFMVATKWALMEVVMTVAHYVEGFLQQLFWPNDMPGFHFELGDRIKQGAVSPRGELLKKIGGGKTMATMTISELERVLANHRTRYGDVPVALWELDRACYYTLAPDNIEAQRMKDGSLRLSIGVNGFTDPTEPQPASRPVVE